MKIAIVLTTLASLIFLSSCNESHDNQMMNSSIESFISVVPNDNATDVGINDVIKLKFASPVNPEIIENNMVLISKLDMSDSNCPMSNNMGHSDMNAAMKDSMMMSHLKNIHKTKGSFKWSPDNTMCEFQPEPGLLSEMDYMIYIDSPMLQHMKQMMSGSSLFNKLKMMDCDCMKKTSGNRDMMVMHFKTKSQINTISETK